MMKSGENSVRDADALSTLRDVARILARRSQDGPAALQMALRPDQPIWLNERIITQIRGYLFSLRAQIRDQLALESPMAADQGSAPALLHYLYARAIEAQFAERPGFSHAELPPGVQALISGPDARLADLGMGFLVAQNRFLRGCEAHRFATDELPAELLHGLVHDMNLSSPQVAEMLSAHDESRTRTAILARIAPLLAQDADWKSHPNLVDHWGAGLFLALLAEQVGLTFDHLLWLAAEPGQLRLAVLLRAAGLTPDAAMESLLGLHHEAMPERDARLTVRFLEQVSLADAQTMVALWSAGPGGG